MWKDKLKEAGVNIHVIATGAGAGLQQFLWEVPGSSAYLSGCSFPYAVEEQEELLGFMPEHFCSEEAAVDLASAAYMKAYKFGGKAPVGVGVTASVTSDKEHRGEHRAFICIMTNTNVAVDTLPLVKGVFKPVDTLNIPIPNTSDRAFRYQLEGLDWRREQRELDGFRVDNETIYNLFYVLNVDSFASDKSKVFKDATAIAKERFMARPFFTANGKRLDKLAKGGKLALMPGAFNPPHEGHFGAAQAAIDDYNYKSIFEITSDPPHKDALSVQALLQRAKLLQGYDRLFTSKLPLYLDKARKYPGRPLILGTDAMVRMLDPKWGLDIGEMFNAFYDLGTKLFISNREVNGVMTTYDNVIDDIKAKFPFKTWASAKIVMKPLKGEWNISSTELRDKLNKDKSND